jgi:Trk K+ transport system NAD-binding subunit
VPAPSELVGKTATAIDFEGRRRVVAVSRFGVPRVPDSKLTVQEGDILHVSLVRGDVADLAEDLKKIGQPE